MDFRAALKRNARPSLPPNALRARRSSFCPEFSLCLFAAHRHHLLNRFPSVSFYFAFLFCFLSGSEVTSVDCWHRFAELIHFNLKMHIVFLSSVSLSMRCGVCSLHSPRARSLWSRFIVARFVPQNDCVQRRETSFRANPFTLKAEGKYCSMRVSTVAQETSNTLSPRPDSSGKILNVALPVESFQLCQQNTGC